MAETKEVIHEREFVPSSSGGDGDGGMGFILGIIILLAFMFLFFYYLLPNITRSVTPPQVNVPSKIDVNVNKK